MHWCHNCSQTFCAQFHYVNCPHCGSSAIQEDLHDDPASQFRPYIIPPSILSLLPQGSIPDIDLSGYDYPVRLVVQTTVLQSQEDPRKFRVVREYFVVPEDSGIRGSPVDEELLLKLKRVEELEGCSICQDEHREQGIELPCQHAFHKKCIQPWLKQTNTCPCCRGVIS